MTVLDRLEVKGRLLPVTIDADGYLMDMNEWDENVAAALASREGIGALGEDKVEILKFIRTYYVTYGFFPILRAVCKNVNKPRNCMNEDFPDALVAWKLAGLPHPEEPVISLLKAGQSPG